MQLQKINKKHWPVSLVVFFCYIFLTGLLTFPVIKDIGLNIAGLGSDSHQVVRSAINHANEYRQIGLEQSIISIIKNIQVDPVSINTYLYSLIGFPLGYNLFWIFSFVIASFGAFIATRYILELALLNAEHREGDPDQQYKKRTAINIASFISGIIYGFAPLHVAWSMGFAGASHIEWIPITTFFILKFIRKPGFSSFFFSSLFFLLLTRGEVHFAAFYIIFLIPFLGYYLYQHREVLRNRKFQFYTALSIITAGAFLLIPYYSYIKIARSSTNWLDPGLKQVSTYSNDVLSSIIPPFTNTIWGDAFASIRDKFTGNRFENSAYIGILVIGLSLCGLLYKRVKDSLFWFISACVFYIFSLGPFLHVNGLIQPGIPLPYFLLYQYVPFFDNIRAANRFAVIAMFCFAVASGFGMTYILMNFSKNQLRNVVGAAMFILIIADYFPGPIPTTSLSYPSFYDKIKTEPGDFSILEIPGATNYRFASRSQYYESLHRKKTINLFQFARANESDPQLVHNKTTPIIKDLLYDFPRGNNFHADIIEQNYEKLGKGILQKDNVKYITIQKKFLGKASDELLPKNFVYIKNFLEDKLKLRKVYDDEDLIAYTVDKSTDPYYVLTLGDKWKRLDKDEFKDTVRWTQASGAQLFIENNFNESRNIALSFQVRTDKKTARKVGIYMDSKLKDSFIVGQTYIQRKLFLDNIAPGKQTVELRFTDLEGNVADEAKPGLQIKNIQYSDQEAQDKEVANQYQQIYDSNPHARIIQIPYHSHYRLGNLNEKGVIVGEEALMEQIDSEFDEHILNVNRIGFGGIFDYKNIQAFRSIDFRDQSFYSSLVSASYQAEHVSHIVIHKNLLKPDEFNTAYQYFDRNLAHKTIVDKGNLVIFEVNYKNPLPDLLFAFPANWDTVKNKHYRFSRAITDTSYVVINNTTNTTKHVTLHFAAQTCTRAVRKLKFNLDGYPAGSLMVGEYPMQYELPISQLSPGEHKLAFRQFDQKGNFVSMRKELNHCPVAFAFFDLK